MRRLSKASRDRDLEAKLRDGRPAPGPELTRAIADRVRPRRAASPTGRRRVPLGVAGGLSAIVLTAVVALGGPGQALSAATSQLSLDSRAAAPASSQYGNRVTACVLGRIQTRRARRVVTLLTTLKVAKLGPCAAKPGRRAAVLRKRPRKSICVLNQLQTKLYRPIARSLIKLGVATSKRCPKTA